MNYKTILITILILVLATPALLYAQTSTQSATASADNGAAEEIRNAVKEKVKEKLHNLTQRQVGIVGTVKSLTTNALTVTSDNDTFTIATSDKVQYQKIPGKRPIKRDEIEINQWVLVMGYLPAESKSVDARIIQVISEPQKPKFTTLFGKISQSTTKKITLTTNDNQTWTITTNKSTTYTQKETSFSLNTVKNPDLLEGMKVIIGGTPDEKLDQTLSAAFIHILPSGPIPAVDEAQLATQSATPTKSAKTAKTATSSATASGKKK